MRLRSPGVLERDCGDLDLVAGRGSSKETARFFREAGYEPDVSFNALNSKERLLFLDAANRRQVDVFVGSFRMCHAIPLDGRLEVDQRTIPLAELLLTKLQVIELNEKDVQDALAVLAHPIGDGDGETLNGARVARLCADDWGLWRTITANLETCRALAGRHGVDAAGAISELLARIEDEPKSRGWRLRAKVGERKRWYEVPEEVG